jgi:hypothetical protein
MNRIPQSAGTPEAKNDCLLRPFRSCKYVVGNNKKCTTWNMSCLVD